MKYARTPILKQKKSEENEPPRSKLPRYRIQNAANAQIQTATPQQAARNLSIKKELQKFFGRKQFFKNDYFL